MTDALRLPAFSFTRTRLSNGLDVIARHEARLPLVAVNLWYHVGSKNERRGQRGFAHLFEHLMFEGSEHFPDDFFKPLQRLGAAVNGSTSTDRTNYFVDLPSAHVELAVAMEADRMGHLVPALSDQKLRVQKDVVKNEYRQNYANRPYGQVWKLIAEALHPPGHPYGWLTIGAMEDVEAATRDDVEGFFRRFYVPANASLCLVGAIDEDRALALAERYFGPIAGGVKAGLPSVSDAPLAAPVEIRLHDRVELERVYLVWPSVRHFHDDDAALTLLADLIARGKSSRLHRRLVMEREVAQDVSAHQSGRELAGGFGVHATLRPGRSPEAVIEAVDAEIEALARDGATDAELDRVKNARLAGFFFALDSIGGFGGVADRLNAYNVYLGDPGRITTDFERYQRVSNSDLTRAARRYLAGRPRVQLTVVRHKETTTLPPLDRSVRPQSAPALPFRAPVPQVYRLRSGPPLWVIPRRDLPVVAATLVVGGGAGDRAEDPHGLAALASAMMIEGTSGRSSGQIAEAAESRGTSFSTGCGWDGSYVSFQCLSPHLEAALELTADVVRGPSFPEAEWARLKGQTLAALRAEHDSAEARAHRALLTALYPTGHPYRRPLDGDESSVEGLTRDDLVGFHQGRYGPARAAWVVAGDVDADRLADAIDRHLEGWNGPAPRPDEVSTPTRAERPRIVLLHRPGSVQAAVRAGHVGMRRLDPDHTDGQVLNHILGGQFNSRLNARLREEKGFTYGVRSHFESRRLPGPFHIGASVQLDRLGEAVDDLYQEVRALLEDRPPTPAELDDARRSLIEGQARLFETPASLVSRYAGLFVHGLPVDHHARFAERLGAVTIDSLRSAAARLVHPEALVVVVVADADRAARPLSALGWADLEVLES